MLVCWNERLIPMRQMRCGAALVMSRPASHTRPASGRRCPVMMLNRVDFPAPLGPMTAAICPPLGGEADAGDRRKSVEGLLDVVHLKHGCDLAA